MCSGSEPVHGSNGFSAGRENVAVSPVKLRPVTDWRRIWSGGSRVRLVGAWERSGSRIAGEKSRASARVPIRRTRGVSTKEGSGGSQHFLVTTTTFFALYVPSGMWVDRLGHRESTSSPLVGHLKRTPVHRI